MFGLFKKKKEEGTLHSLEALSNHGESMWMHGYDEAIDDCCLYLNIVRKDLNLTDEQVEGIRKFYNTLKG